MADVAGNSSTTSTLTVGGSTTNALEVRGDHDWFAINLVAGQQITASLFGISLVDPLLNIRNASGQVVASNDDIKSGSDRNSQITFTPAASGTYYIDAGAFNEAYAGTYQVSVQAGTQPPLATIDTIAGYLTQGYWGGDSHHFAASQGGTITVNLSTLNSAEQNLARNALQEWSDVIGVHFQEVTAGGQIVFDDSEDSSGNPVAATDASWSGGITSSAHVHISSSWVNRYGTGLNTYSFQTYIHEIGHSLGLGHAGDYNGSATYSTDALFQNDAWSTSIMSYFDERQNTYFGSQGFSRDFAVTPMDADIVAMQTLYGLSTTTRTGDTTYGFNSNAGGVFNASVYPNVAFTIVDSAGYDTIDYSLSSASQLINLNPETFSSVNGNIGNLSIARGTLIENAVGGTGNDTIIGNALDNAIKGGLGSDILTGGPGNDTFIDTIAAHNGDTITDFSVGDKLVFTDATLGSFSFSLAGATLTYTGGTLSFGSAPALSLVASGVSGGGVQLTFGSMAAINRSAHNDFNGDGRSDVLLRNTDGTVNEWLGMQDGGFASNIAHVNYDLTNDWHVAGTGDFNGDGRTDVLWRNTSGTVNEWLSLPDGSFASNIAHVNYGITNDWHVIGTGDFNGDGLADVLWRNDDGTLRDWLGQADGSFQGNIAHFNINVATYMHVVGTGDFNGDGRDDLIWRGDDGTVREWLGQADGSFLGNIAHVNYNIPSDWHIVATGDFNGDGLSDLVWRSDDGTMRDWLGQADGSFQGNIAHFNVNMSSDWHIVGTGDFNGDGIADLLWQNNDGTIHDWLGRSDGSFMSNFFNVDPGVQWHVQDPFVHDPFL